MTDSRSLDRRILALAVPAFASLVAHPLFLLADSAIVGHLGTEPLAGLGIASAVLATLVGLFIFLAYTTTAGVSRRLGAGDQRGALSLGISGMWLALMIGVAVAVAGWWLAESAVRGLGASDAVTPYAVTYLRWSLPGLPAMLVVLASVGVLRGLQDTRTPLVVSVTGAVVNLGLNIWLVYGMSMGVAGSALGTSLTQVGMGMAMCFMVIRAGRRQGAVMAPHWGEVWQSVGTGTPLLIRTLTLRAALLVTTFVAARMGDEVLAGHQVAFTVWSFMAMAIEAIEIAAQAIIGHSLGAGDLNQTRALMRRLIRWSVGSGVVLGVGLGIVTPWLPSLFTRDPDVRTAIVAALIVVAVGQPLAAYVFVLDGVLVGAGDGPYLAKAGILTVVTYAPCAAAVLAWSPGGITGLVWLWVAFVGVFMTARALTLGLRARGEKWMVVGAK